MAGKEQKSEFALVWWLDEKLTSIVPIKVIKRKSRKINEIYNLIWEDKGQHTKSLQKAKILALGDYNKLNEINVDSEGKICTKGVKVFSSSIMKEKHKISSEKKQENISKKHKSTNFAKELVLEEPLIKMPSPSSTNKNSNIIQFHQPSTSSSESNRNIQNYTVRSIDSLSLDGVESESSNDDEHEGHKPSCEENNSPINDEMSELAYLLFPNGVTKRDIENQRNYLKVMEKVYELQLEKDNHSEEIYDVSTEYTKSGISKVEVIADSGLYFSNSIKTLIETKAKYSQEVEWKTLTRLALFEIYGSTLKNYSAYGMRSLKPPLNPVILEGIYLWASSRMPDGESLDRSEFVRHVNTTSNNKKRYQKKKSPTAGDENTITKRQKTNTNVNYNQPSYPHQPPNSHTPIIINSHQQPYYPEQNFQAPMYNNINQNY